MTPEIFIKRQCKADTVERGSLIQSLCITWADFHRFIMGWSPTHPKNTPFSQQLTEQALSQLRRS